MSIKKKLEWLDNLNAKGIILGLERVDKLAKALNNPQNNFLSIHVAGTNGKGSVAKLIYTILREQGYSVGLYTSPHILKFNERIIVNDKEIEDKTIARLIDYIKPLLEKNQINVTFFEFTTLMAFLYFVRKKVDIAIIETGMGGRLDATNIISPIITIITTISLDHQQYLGNTIEKIAWEKASIIKNGTPVVTQNSGKTLNVIKGMANKRKAELFAVRKLTIIKPKKGNLSILPNFQEAEIKTNEDSYNIKTNLLGNYQLTNIATAILACEIINKKIKIQKESIINGIKKTYWPARLEIVRKSPFVMIDGSHNTQGFKTLKQFLNSDIKANFNHITLILGISNNKDKKSMIPLIANIPHRIILCQAKYRGTPTKCLKKIVKKYNKNILEIKRVDSAVKKALAEAIKKDAIIISGSLFVAGEAKKALNIYNRNKVKY